MELHNPRPISSKTAKACSHSKTKWCLLKTAPSLPCRTLMNIETRLLCAQVQMASRTSSWWTSTTTCHRWDALTPWESQMHLISQIAWTRCNMRRVQVSSHPLTRTPTQISVRIHTWPQKLHFIINKRDKNQILSVFSQIKLLTTRKKQVMCSLWNSRQVTQAALQDKR